MGAERPRSKNRNRQEELIDLLGQIQDLRNGLRNIEAGLQRENDGLREALAPFARFADRHDRPPNGRPLNADSLFSCKMSLKVDTDSHAR